MQSAPVFTCGLEPSNQRLVFTGFDDGLVGVEIMEDPSSQPFGLQSYFVSEPPDLHSHTEGSSVIGILDALGHVPTGPIVKIRTCPAISFPRPSISNLMAVAFAKASFREILYLEGMTSP